MFCRLSKFYIDYFFFEDLIISYIHNKVKIQIKKQIKNLSQILMKIHEIRVHLKFLFSIVQITMVKFVLCGDFWFFCVIFWYKNIIILSYYIYSFTTVD